MFEAPHTITLRYIFFIEPQNYTAIVTEEADVHKEEQLGRRHKCGYSQGLFVMIDFFMKLTAPIALLFPSMGTDEIIKVYR